MREIKSGDLVMRIRASNLARTFFFQEFGTDLDTELEPIVKHRMETGKRMLAGLTDDQIKAILDCQGIQNAEPEAAVEIIKGSTVLKDEKLTEKLYALALSQPKIPPMSALKLLWAMNAAQNFSEGVQTPAFDQWIIHYDEFNVNSCMDDIIAEVDRGFFTS